jgi:hypothetical protein
MRLGHFCPVVGILVAGVAMIACTLTLDYEKLESASGAADGGPPSAGGVRCAGETCGKGDLCCLAADGKSRCATSNTCTGTAAACLSANDCATGMLCCGWGRAGGTGTDALVVACRTRTECGTRDGARVVCTSSVTPPCPEANDRCIPTETAPGGSKCANASDAL